MRLTEWLPSLSPCRVFTTHEQLYRGLQQLDNQAIVCLQLRTAPTIKKLVKQYNLPAEQTEEILNQASLVFLQKIESGAYVFQGYAPTTYLIEIAKRMVSTTARRRKPANEPLDGQLQVAAEDYATLERQQSAADLVKRFLGQLGERCAQVIRLHHIDGYRDEEVIQENMTPYSTINSLKMKRSDCMKKLIQIAQAWRTSTTT